MPGEPLSPASLLAAEDMHGSRFFPECPLGQHDERAGGRKYDIQYVARCVAFGQALFAGSPVERAPNSTITSGFTNPYSETAEHKRRIHGLLRPITGQTSLPGPSSLQRPAAHGLPPKRAAFS